MSSSKRILVVDDNADLANAFGKLIAALGQEVKVVTSGAAAIEAAPDFKPDIIFLDIAMPEMDGYETAKKLRENKNIASATLIALTGFGQEEYKQKAKEAGFDKYLIKPVSLADIEKIINE